MFNPNTDQIDFKVAGRFKVDFLSSIEHKDRPHIVISVRNVGKKKVNLSVCENRIDTLYLEFNDIHFDDDHAERYLELESFLNNLKLEDGKNKDEIETIKNLKRNIFTRSDAMVIKEFVDLHIDNINMIICQCEAGISRSSAIAAAISDYLSQESSGYFNSYNYLPNIYVYNLLRSVLCSDKKPAII